MSIGSRYEPAAIESRWQEFWESRGFCHADEYAPGPSYTIVIPPPNITGILHMGHGLNNTLQDVLVRRKRMAGFNALWVPGTDHAGIATQNVVERELLKENLRKEDLGREAFLERVWRWREEKGGAIIQQLKCIGSSCDWERIRFTLDEGLSRAVRTVFKRLYDEGLVYKGNYIINWCPRCLTALADDEVDHKERAGNLWHLKYPVEGQPGRFCIVATTRPETMLGDTAVAVNPADERYRDLVGKHCILPILNRAIPIIADDFVDREFGTGMVKVTPAHDPNDWAMGKRNELAEIVIMHPNGVMNENAGPYDGLTRFECRKKIVEDLQAGGFLEKTEDYKHNVGHCYRCHTAIEPYVSKQWFVKMKPLAEPAIAAVEDGRTRLIPETWNSTYFHWMNNVRDWCISRQLWWGHRIPAWSCDACGVIEVSADEAPERCSVCGSTALTQDPDVLDTWFSSALWPFSTLGWPENTRDLKVYYPTSVLVTAHEILFFWVARMIMMGLKFMGDVPFRDVYIHPMVFDEKTKKKMSKSLGNVIDPLKMIEKYGADALRMTLCAYAIKGRNLYLSEERFMGYRNFMNKLWNASRFILTNTEDLSPEELAQGLDRGLLKRGGPDRWILSAFARTVREAENALDSYSFDQVVNIVYHFVWHEFCDWYLEFSKPALYSRDREDVGPESERIRANAQKTLLLVLEGVLRLLHPIIPFITEELWQIVRERFVASDAPPTASAPEAARFFESLGNPSIMIAPWQQAIGEEFICEKTETTFATVKDTIYTVRNIRGEMNIPPGADTDVFINGPENGALAVIRKHEALIESLLNTKKLCIGEAAPAGVFASTGVVGDMTVLVALPEEMRKAEAERLARELERLNRELAGMEAKMSNENFVSRAPAEVVEGVRARMEQSRHERFRLEEQLGLLQG